MVRKTITTMLVLGHHIVFLMTGTGAHMVLHVQVPHISLTPYNALASRPYHYDLHVTAEDIGTRRI